MIESQIPNCGLKGYCWSYIEEESDMCKRRLLEFTETLPHERENKTEWNLDAYVVAIWNGTQIGLNLCNVGKPIFIPSSIAICERIFQTKCNQKPLAQQVELEDPWCSYAGLSLWAWSGCNGLGYHLQHLKKHARPKDTYARLISFFLVTSQDHIMITQNTSCFLKYCVTQNWGDILE